MQKTPLFLSVRNPERLIFEGEVQAISSINDKGPFDILPEHENFISIIKKNLVLYTKNGKQEIKLDSGILKVASNRAYVFLGIESLPQKSV